MDISKLKRNSQIVHDSFAIVDGKVIAKQDCSFLVPYNYINHKLAKTGEQIFIAAVFAIVVGDSYGVMNACANIQITPSEINQIKIAGDEYFEFNFVAGSVVTTTKIVMDSDLLYEMNKYFYTYGRVPWFMSYADVNRVLAMHKEYGGLNISPNNIPFEIVASKICRDPKNKFVYYRHSDLKGNPVVVPFNSVLFNATNTTAKLLGNYLSDGFTSAILSPSDRTEMVETLLRQ